MAHIKHRDRWNTEDLLAFFSKTRACAYTRRLFWSFCFEQLVERWLMVRFISIFVKLLNPNFTA